MTVKNAAGTTQTKSGVMSSMTDVTPDANKVYRFDGVAQLFTHFTPDGVLAVESAKKVALVPGRTYTKSEIDKLFPSAVVSTITPSTGLAAAGGTTLTIKGQYLTGVTAITFGGTAGTSLNVVDENTITIVTPAKAAGTYNVVLTDDSGTVTVTNGVTYV
jgi:hypothetical protein